MGCDLGTAITERLRWGAECLRPGASVCVHCGMWTRLPAGPLTAPAHVHADSGHLSATEMNRPQLLTTTRVNLMNEMLQEKSKLRKCKSMILFIKLPKINKTKENTI